MGSSAEPCPTCRQLWVWTCWKCGSYERRPDGKGCAECNRARSRKRVPGLSVDESVLFRRLLLDDFEDVVVVPAARAYLREFTLFVLALRDGDGGAVRRASRARGRLLRRLEGL